MQGSWSNRRSTAGQILLHSTSQYYARNFFPFLIIRTSAELWYLYQESLELMGVLEGGGVREGEVGDVSKFLNRILGLKVHQQNLVSKLPSRP